MMLLAFVASTMFVSAQSVSAPNQSAATDSVGMYAAPSISNEAELLFRSLMPHRDSTYVKQSTPKDSFWKRFSFHFNMLEWALTLPGVGVEFDLNATEKNNRSVLLFGKFNPKTSHNYTPQIVFDVAAARVEFRKYWRTGGIGKGRVNHRYEKINLHRPKTLQRTEYIVDNFDSIPNVVEYYANHADSMLAEQYTGDPNRSWLYNRYHQFRRNVTSTRTLRSPRNWRAYYLGAYAGVEKWDLCFNKKGKRGSGVYVGATMGWSIPLLTRRFPKEGGLDLDLGALVGIKAVKYDAYKFVSSDADYMMLPAQSKSSWSIVKWPVLQELHIGLAYRFRSISRKVSLSIVDDYEKRWVEPFDQQREQTQRAKEDAANDRRMHDLQQHREAIVAADSTAFWNNWHERRLVNALKVNPDTVFTGMDQMLFQKLLLSNEDSKAKKLTQKKNKGENKKQKSDKTRTSKIAQKRERRDE